mgnify:CR=1 FL=1
MKLKIVVVLLALIIATVCIAGCVTIPTEENGNSSGKKGKFVHIRSRSKNPQMTNGIKNKL